MNRLIRITALSAVLAMILVASGGATRTTATSLHAAMAPLDVFQAFISAFNSGDVAQAKALLAPGFRHLSDVGTPEAGDEGADQFLTPPLPHAEATNVHQTGSDTVEADVTISGGNLPPLPHPFTLHSTFTIVNGLIVKTMDVTSPQTIQDLSALGPRPGSLGMPTTGESSLGAAALLLALGLFCVLSGVALRRAFLLNR